MVDSLYPDVGRAALTLLERHGADVVFPEAQTCCGQPAYNTGYRDDAKAMATHFLEVFGPLLESGAVGAIVAPSGSCTAMIRHGFGVVLRAADPETRQRCDLVAARTFELTEYLVDGLGVTSVDASWPGTVTYHACCHLLRELRVDHQPRGLLRSVAGATTVDHAGDTECCGFGGLFAIENAAISTAMGTRKVDAILEAGADTVAVADVSCMTHLNGLLGRCGHPCRARHIAELLVGGELDGRRAG